MLLVDVEFIKFISKYDLWEQVHSLAHCLRKKITISEPIRTICATAGMALSERERFRFARAGECRYYSAHSFSPADRCIILQEYSKIPIRDHDKYLLLLLKKCEGCMAFFGDASLVSIAIKKGLDAYCPFGCYQFMAANHIYAGNFKPQDLDDIFWKAGRPSALHPGCVFAEGSPKCSSPYC